MLKPECRHFANGEWNKGLTAQIFDRAHAFTIMFMLEPFRGLANYCVWKVPPGGQFLVKSLATVSSRQENVDDPLSIAFKNLKNG